MGILTLKCYCPTSSGISENNLLVHFIGKYKWEEVGIVCYFVYVHRKQGKKRKKRRREARERERECVCFLGGGLKKGEFQIIGWMCELTKLYKMCKGFILESYWWEDERDLCVNVINGCVLSESDNDVILGILERVVKAKDVEIVDRNRCDGKYVLLDS